MKSLFEKSVLFGIGALSLTKEKAEKFLADFEEKGEVTSSEAKKFINDLMERGERERKVINEMVKKQIDEVLNKMGYVSRSELNALEQRVKELEAERNTETNQ